MEDQQFNSKEKLRYVIVELVAERGSASSIEKGLFKGLKREFNQDFIWIRTNSEVVRACNLAFYNILSIESYNGDVRRFTFFQASIDEQKMARNAIKSVLLALDDRVSKASGLIEASKYTDVPDNFGSTNKNHMPRTSAAHTPSCNKPSIYTPTGSPAFGHDYYDHMHSYEKKEPEPLPFKRKSRKPTKAALKKLNAKLNLIDKGEYEYEMPEINPEVKED